MANLERAIYSIAYYWHGIPKRGVLGVMWLYDALHHTEMFEWSKVGGLPYHQAIVDKIDEMIVSGDLRIVDRWKQKFSNVGLEPVYSENSPKLYKPSQNFSENFRKIVKYFLNNVKEFRQFYTLYENKVVNTQQFYKYYLDQERLSIKQRNIKKAN